MLQASSLWIVSVWLELGIWLNWLSRGRRIRDIHLGLDHDADLRAGPAQARQTFGPGTVPATSVDAIQALAYTHNQAATSFAKSPVLSTAG